MKKSSQLSLTPSLASSTGSDHAPANRIVPVHHDTDDACSSAVSSKTEVIYDRLQEHPMSTIDDDAGEVLVPQPGNARSRRPEDPYSVPQACMRACGVCLQMSHVLCAGCAAAVARRPTSRRADQRIVFGIFVRAWGAGTAHRPAAAHSPQVTAYVACCSGVMTMMLNKSVAVSWLF